jgi:hypothetical protein
MTIEIADWVQDEFRALQLGDTRLDQRAQKLISEQYYKPQATSYAAALDSASVKANQRFKKTLK